MFERPRLLVIGVSSYYCSRLVALLSPGVSDFLEVVAEPSRCGLPLFLGFGLEVFFFLICLSSFSYLDDSLPLESRSRSLFDIAFCFMASNLAMALFLCCLTIQGQQGTGKVVFKVVRSIMSAACNYVTVHIYK